MPGKIGFRAASFGIARNFLTGERKHGLTCDDETSNFYFGIGHICAILLRCYQHTRTRKEKNRPFCYSGLDSSLS